jgi:DNA-binding CsgD family transcriptional regulator
MTHLLIVGGEKFTFETMRFALSRTTGATLFGVVPNGTTDIATAIAESRAEVIVVDGLGDASAAVGALEEIRAAAPDALLLIVVPERTESVEAGAAAHDAVVCVWPGVVGATRERLPSLSSSPPFGEHDDASRGSRPHSPLTSRELETLGWVVQGHTNAWIARKLWVTEQTVKFHLSNIYRKLGVANRTEASHYALVHDLFENVEVQDARPGRFDGVAQSMHR